MSDIIVVNELSFDLDKVFFIKSVSLKDTFNFVSEPDDKQHWIWQGSFNSGYPYMTYRVGPESDEVTRIFSVSKILYMAWTDSEDLKFFNFKVRSMCGEKACINPEHKTVQQIDSIIDHSDRSKLVRRIAHGPKAVDPDWKKSAKEYLDGV